MANRGPSLPSRLTSRESGSVAVSLPVSGDDCDSDDSQKKKRRKFARTAIDFFQMRNGCCLRWMGVLMVLGCLWISVPHLWHSDRGSSGVELLPRQRNAVKQLSFGDTVKGQEDLGRDSRAWDTDDRDRSSLASLADSEGDKTRNSKLEQDDFKGHLTDDDVEEGDTVSEEEAENSVLEGLEKTISQVEGNHNSGLYNEKGRKELRMYEKKFQAALIKELNSHAQLENKEDPQDERHSRSASEKSVHGRNTTSSVAEDDEYDDDGGETGTIRRGSDVVTDDDQEEEKGDGDVAGGHVQLAHDAEAIHRSDLVNSQEEQPELWKGSFDKHTKVKKRRSVPCEIAFANLTTGVSEPEDNSKFARFSLRYVEQEKQPAGDLDWEPRFAGHQTMAEREATFHATTQTLHCGFVKGPKGTPSTGFDISDDDQEYLSSCQYAVASAIFNNSDHIRSPTMKKVSVFSKKNICFVMFVDQTTLDVMEQENQGPNLKGRVGLWRVVLVTNMPFSDGRRTGKVPKLLSHRLFTSARYSIWLDSKLRLQADPLLIFEYFLWRRGAEYAISNHYDRHDVGEEVLQNKKLNKFNHTIIDQQYRFYQQDGLTRFNASDPHKLLPSYVPEGSFIVRAHTPMSNLFSCLWFNEVDRFTPRDQLSFAYTYLKLARMNSETSFAFYMFKDCERKALAKLFHHRHEDRPSRVNTTTATDSSRTGLQ